MAPFEVPLAGFIVAGGASIAFSRVLLTSSELGAVLVAMRHRRRRARHRRAHRHAAEPVVERGGRRPHRLAIGVVVVGVASAARGERFIEEHEEEHAEAEASTRRGRRAHEHALTPEGTKSVTTTTVAEEEG